MRFQDQRKNMVDRQLVARGIEDERIIRAFLKVKRHEFVPEDYRHMAYEDHPVSIGGGQTISQPYIVALMIKILDVKEDDDVLEIGTGSGYQTAILAELANRVFTVERNDSLAISARKILRKLKYKNIHFRIGDGTMGWEKAYPKKDEFDKIIVSAAAPYTPKPLIEQIAEKGKLIIPVGAKFSQDLLLITKKDGEIKKRNYGGCAFVPLVGKQGW